MADVNSQVALGVNAPDPQQGLTTLSKIMGLGQQGLAIQGQKSQNQSLQAEAQGAQQQMQERQLLQQTLKSGVRPDNGKSLYTANNELDPDQLADFANKNLPLTGQSVVQNVLKTKSDKIALANSAADLTDKYKNDLSGITRSFVNNPQAKSQDVNDALKTYAQQNPEAAPAVLAATNWIQHIDSAPDMKAKNDVLIHVAQLLQPAATTAGQQTPSIATMQSPKGLQPIQTNPLAAGGVGPTGAALPQGVAPGTTQLPGGNIGVVGPSGTVRTANDISAPQPAAASKLPPMQRPGINAPAADQANYNTRIKQAGDEYQAVSGAANDPQNGVQVSRYRNGQILDLTKVAPTGPGKEIWNHVASQIPGEGADAFQKIGHYLAQNSAAMAGKMGVPNTNMGQETAAAAAGNTSQNPKAIAEITRVNDALNTGFDLYNRGLAKVTNNGSDLSRAASFKQAFGSNVDVNALRWADANRRGDKEELQSLSKQGPAAIASWQKKLTTLKSLATAGDLP